MSARLALFAPLLLLSCSRAGPPPTAPAEPQPVPVEGPVPIEPGVFRGGGISMVIPQDWQALRGPPSTALVIAADHPETGARLEIWSFPSSGPVQPRPRPKCERRFEDHVGSYRSIPALTPTRSSSCAFADGRRVLSWYARLGGAELHVDLHLSPGRAVAGRLAAESLMFSLAPEDSDVGAGPRP